MFIMLPTHPHHQSLIMDPSRLGAGSWNHGMRALNELMERRQRDLVYGLTYIWHDNDQTGSDETQTATAYRALDNPRGLN